MKNKNNIFCLFVHAGRIMPDMADTLTIPMGMVMLASLLDTNGYKSKIANITLNKLTGSDDIDALIKKYNPSAIGFSLHWHNQTKSVMDLISYVKTNYKNIKIFAGGFTASYFYKDIISSKNGPDFVVRGDGEIPVLALAEKIKTGGQDYSSVSNLVWKNKGKVVINPLSYVANSESISKLKYSGYELADNKDEVMKGRMRCKLKDGKAVFDETKSNVVFYNPGRGCPYECCFCGGCNSAQLKINGRKGYFFKSIESALEDVKYFVEQGFHTMHMCFDPEPDYKWYIKFFKAFEKAKINIACNFECWDLPTKEFLDVFKNAVKDNILRSRIIISPDSGNEKIRLCNKGFSYTNLDLKKVLAYLKELGIPVELSFIPLQPGENKYDFARTMTLANECVEKYSCETTISVPSLDPASPMYENPHKHGIKLTKKSFKDFINKYDDIGWLPENDSENESETLKKYFDRKKLRPAIKDTDNSSD